MDSAVIISALKLNLIIEIECTEHQPSMSFQTKEIHGPKEYPAGL